MGGGHFLLYSVLPGEHQREHTQRPFGIARVFGVVPHALIEIVYLPEERAAHQAKAA